VKERERERESLARTRGKGVLAGFLMQGGEREKKKEREMQNS